MPPQTFWRIEGARSRSLHAETDVLSDPPGAPVRAFHSSPRAVACPLGSDLQATFPPADAVPPTLLGGSRTLGISHRALAILKEFFTAKKEV